MKFWDRVKDLHIAVKEGTELQKGKDPSDRRSETNDRERPAGMAEAQRMMKKGVKSGGAPEVRPIG